MSKAAQMETKGEQNVLRVPYPALRATLPKGEGFWERKRFKDAYKPSPLGKVSQPKGGVTDEVFPSGQRAFGHRRWRKPAAEHRESQGASEGRDYVSSPD